MVRDVAALPVSGQDDAVNKKSHQMLDIPRAGRTQIFAGGKWVHQRELLSLQSGVADYMKEAGLKDQGVGFIIAPTVGGRYEFANAFLLGYQPFTVEKNWIPLSYLSSEISYQLDHEQFHGRQEVWLTSAQTWKARKGDCEDHAILLADWLISMGVDARVVIGRHGDEGHAWVVVFSDGNEYIIEATHKSKLNLWSSYPLASMLPDYHPEYTFNDKYLWKNNGSPLTVKYSGDKWQKIALFEVYP